MIKKALFFLLLALIGLGSSFAVADRSDDYRVIQQAVKKDKPEAPEGAGKIAWFRIEVTEKGKATVKIKLPISLIEMIAASCPESFRAGKAKEFEIDLRKILEELKKAGPMALVEIEDEDATVKIWLE